MKLLSKLGVALLALAFLFWVFFLNHVDMNEVAIAYNSVDGSIVVQNKPGWYVTSPATRVICFSLLPVKVDVHPGGVTPAKVITQKIVRLKSDGVLDLIHREGFSYTLSMDIKEKLTAYAFSGQKFSFLEIVEEGK